ncbi:ribonuclease P component domain protein [Mycobacterium sp. MAC_080597_8934]|nr:ribonuclease P component domain protein [Mycobacterium sp. MAC_011194_8550]ETZ58834.1 ribonuclease P component domain protein [Mycobacterium sp. MAC_080597_8934]
MVRTWRVWPRPASSPGSGRTRPARPPRTGCRSERSDRSPDVAATPYAGRAESGKSVRGRRFGRRREWPRPTAPVRSRPGSRRHASQAPLQFLRQARRRRGPAAGQRANHQPVGWLEFAEQGPGHVTQPAGHAVSLYRRPDGLPDDQPDPWARGFVVGFGVAPEVDDDVGLRHAGSVLHRRVKLG